MAATAMTSSVTTDAPTSTSSTSTTTTSPTSITPTLPISMPTTITTTSTTSSPSTALSLEERFPFLREQTGRRRSRQLLSPEQTNVLLGILRQTRFPSTAVREQAAKELGISPRKVQVFFQNKRQGLRKKMLNAAQDLVDLANSEDTSHDALTTTAATKTVAGAQLQARQRRAMTLGGGRLPARISSPVGVKQTFSSSAVAESRTYDAWRRGGAADDDDGMEVDGEESEDGSPDEGEGEEGETHDDVGQEPMTPTPARLAAMQGRPLAAITTAPHAGPAQRQRAASDAAYLQQRGAAHPVAPRPQRSPIQQQRPQTHHPYARSSPRSATLLPPLQMSPRNNGQAGTIPGALTSSPRRATFSFAATPGPRTMPAPTRALPMSAGLTTTRSPVHVGTVTSPPGAVVLGLSNMAPRHPQQQHQARPHDVARHHQRSISLAAYPMMTGPGPALQHQHQHQQHMSSRVPLQPLAPQPQPQPQPQPPRPQQQHNHSPIQTQPARPTSLRRHASYGHADAQQTQTVATLPFMQWRSGDQSYSVSTMDGNLTAGTTMTTHPSSGTGSSDMEMAWTPSSTRDDGLASKDQQRQQQQVISPRHSHAVATPSRRMHAPLPHQWMQHAHPSHPQPAQGRTRGLSTTRKPTSLTLAPMLDLSLDVPLDVERLAVSSRSPEQPIKRLNGSEQEQEEVSMCMTLPPLRLGASRSTRDESLAAKRRRGTQVGDEDASEDDEDDAPLSKTCARAAAQQQPTTLPSVAELTRTLGLLPWSTKAAAARSVDAASTAVA